MSVAQQALLPSGPARGRRATSPPHCELTSIRRPSKVYLHPSAVPRSHAFFSLCHPPLATTSSRGGGARTTIARGTPPLPRTRTDRIAGGTRPVLARISTFTSAGRTVEIEIGIEIRRGQLPVNEGRGRSQSCRRWSADRAERRGRRARIRASARHTVERTCEAGKISARRQIRGRMNRRGVGGETPHLQIAPVQHR